ncbi:LppA family lipoprotein [Williamsia sp.]|uniref:LppA family lipoprotein n=1 Tax=Williamsia sp. TaxID=1872085 RepID=UPI002F94DBA1
MTQRHRRLWRRVALGTILAAICAFAVAVIFVAGTLSENSTDEGNSMSDEQRAENDIALRNQPSYEAGVEALNAVLLDASTALTREFPYLRFEWRREATFTTCPDHSDPAMSGISASRFADQPIAQADWARAMQIVVDHAYTLGAVETGTYHDETNVHDTIIFAGGFSIRFGSIKATALRGNTPCRLPQDALDQVP